MAYERLGVSMVVNGVAQFARDIGYIVASYSRYERSMASIERRVQSLSNAEIRAANQRASRATKDYSAATNAMQKYSDKVDILTIRLAKQSAEEARLQGIIQNKTRIATAQLLKSTDPKYDAQAQQTYAKYAEANFAKAALALQKLAIVQKEMRKTSTELLVSQGDLATAMQTATDSAITYAKALQAVKDAQAKLEKNATAVNQAMNGLSGFLDVLTGGFAKNIILTSGLSDKLAIGSTKMAALSVALNLGKLALDVFVFGARAVIGVVNLLWGVFMKLVGILAEVGKWVLRIGVDIAKTLVSGLWKIVTFPFAMVKKGFDGIASSLGQMFNIMIGMTASNLIWNLAMQFRNLASEVFQFTVDIQLMQIQLEGLVARDLVKQAFRAGEVREFSDALVEAGPMAKELYNWIVELAITTPFTIETVNRTMALGYSYGFTTSEVKKLTTTLAIFGTGMGLHGDATQRIIENLGQMRAAGKITGTELRDLARGSFVPVNEILQIMATNAGLLGEKGAQTVRDLGKFGKEIPDVLAATEEKLYEMDALLDGKPVDEFIAAFEYWTELNFPGALDRMNRSFTVAISNVADFAKNVGKVLLTPALEEVSLRMNKFITGLFKNKEFNKWLDDTGKQLGETTDQLFKISDAFTKAGLALWNGFLYPIVVGPAIKKIKQFTKDVVALGEAFFTGDWAKFNAEKRSPFLESLADPIAQLRRDLPILDSLGTLWTLLSTGKVTAFGTSISSVGGLLDVWAKKGTDAEVAMSKLGKSLMAGDWKQAWKDFRALANIIKDQAIPALRAFYKDAIEPFLVDIKAVAIDGINTAIGALVGYIREQGPKIQKFLSVDLVAWLQTLNSQVDNQPLKDFISLMETIAGYAGISLGNIINPPQPGGEYQRYQQGGNAKDKQIAAGNAVLEAGKNLGNTIFKVLTDAAAEAGAKIRGLITGALAELQVWSDNNSKVLDPLLQTLRGIRDIDLTKIKTDFETFGSNATKTWDIALALISISESIAILYQKLNLFAEVNAALGVMAGFFATMSPGVAILLKLIEALKTFNWKGFATNFMPWAQNIPNKEQQGNWWGTGNTLGIDTLNLGGGTNQRPGQMGGGSLPGQASFTNIQEIASRTFTAIAAVATTKMAEVSTVTSTNLDVMKMDWINLSDELIFKSIIPDMMNEIYRVMVTKLTDINAALPELLDTMATLFQTWANERVIPTFADITAEVMRLSGWLANVLVQMAQAGIKIYNGSGKNPTTDPYKANGGPVEQGNRYIVGERGPELFIPRYPGFIIPNDKLMQSLRLASSSVNTPYASRGTYNNNSSQMSFYGPMSFSVPSGVDLMTLFSDSI